jgi:hypothetical protein
MTGEGARAHRRSDSTEPTLSGLRPKPHQGFALDPPRAEPLEPILKGMGVWGLRPQRVQGSALALLSC